MRGRTVRSARLGLMLALALASAGRADYPEAFKSGIRAKNFKQWREVEIAMKEAIAEQPRATGEGVRIVGMEYEPYIPHYFLGLALYRQGDCKGAAQAFDDAAVQRTVRGIYRARMDFFQEVCARRLGQPRPAPAPSRAYQTTGGILSPPPAPRVGPSPPPAPAPGPPQPPIEVRQKALHEMVRDGRNWIARGKELVQTLQKRRRALEPSRVEILEVAEQRLHAAAFQLEGCWREGDLEGAERARDDAQAACEMLGELAKGL